MATTRRAASQTQKLHKSQEEHMKPTKRQGDTDVGHDVPKKKRTAFIDLTNAVQQPTIGLVGKKQVLKTAGAKKKSKVVVALPKTKPQAPVTSSQPEAPAEVSWDVIELSQSQEGQSSQETTLSSQSSVSLPSSSESLAESTLQRAISTEEKLETQSQDGDAWENIDAENLSDPFQVAVYADHIFKYYKEREAKFCLPDYISTQTDLTAHMRTILVDWLVEVQENFELNHETLYLAVKIVDLFLSRQQVQRDRLQLVGATALFIACKFDERCPPVLDDFLYICDDAYTKQQVIRMEMTILRTIDFDLGVPLSYRFLRRYAKCARANMETLTLARYILERSLMDYRYTQVPDSKMAAGVLLLALTIKGVSGWTGTLVHYTGYVKDELLQLVVRLNKMISAKPHRNLTTIYSKYSHKVFHEVAKCPALTEEALKQLGVPAETLTHGSPSSSSSSPASSSSSPSFSDS